MKKMHPFRLSAKDKLLNETDYGLFPANAQFQNPTFSLFLTILTDTILTSDLFNQLINHIFSRSVELQVNLVLASYYIHCHICSHTCSP